MSGKAKEEEEEIWKTYPDYPFIEASNLGRIRTKDRTIIHKDGVKQFIKGKVLKQYHHKNGYMYVGISYKGKKISLRVHRIVATCFLPNPNNLPQINHKDCNRANNNVSNLEWCTAQYNMNYKEKYGISYKEGTPKKATLAINLDTFEILLFKSQREAGEKLGISYQNINKVVKGQRDKAGGYWFAYADENAVEKVRKRFGYNNIAKNVEELMRQN